MSERYPEDPALDLYLALMEVDWPTVFDAATLSRGLGYAHKGRGMMGSTCRSAVTCWESSGALPVAASRPT
ncbi:hypothetical protein HAALTHF_18290n [Vreelandella aquamarina]|nr:hypothetical protein HAALTHF_18290n [Halomonas axialensis]